MGFGENINLSYMTDAAIHPQFRPRRHNLWHRPDRLRCLPSEGDCRADAFAGLSYVEGVLDSEWV